MILVIITGHTFRVTLAVAFFKIYVHLIFQITSIEAAWDKTQAHVYIVTSVQNMFFLNVQSDDKSLTFQI